MSWSHSLLKRLRLWWTGSAQSTTNTLQSLDPLEVVKQNTPAAFDFFWKSDYAIQQYMEPARQRILAQISDVIASVSEAGPLLDVGCGPGHLFAYVAMKQPALPPNRMIGVDYSQVAVKQARQRVSGAVFAIADASRLPFADHVFSCVSCIETLEHVLNPQSVAKELERVTVIGGTIVISVPNKKFDTWNGHRHFFTIHDLQQLFSTAHLVSWELANENRGILVILQR